MLFAGVVSCSSLNKHSNARLDNNASVIPQPVYSGPKAKIAVAEFQVKAAKANHQIGIELREMFIAALLNSNRFSVVERQQLDEVVQQQEQTAAVAPVTAQKSKIKTADLIVTAVVIEFEPKASGGSGGIGGGGGKGSGFLGGLGGSFNKAHMALELRLLDAATLKVLAATRLQGEATDTPDKITANLYIENFNLGTALLQYAKTPMEKAIRICIIEAGHYVCQEIPKDYYKY